MIKVETSSLRNGVAMPKIGLGTFPCKGEELVQGIASAIALGYRAFDTGTHYENEPDIAAGIRLSGEDRKNLFITSKFWNVNPGYDHAMRAFENSLKLLETDYVDLYLIHFPNLALHVETWKALEQIYNCLLYTSSLFCPLLGMLVMVCATYKTDAIPEHTPQIM